MEKWLKHVNFTSQQLPTRLDNCVPFDTSKLSNFVTSRKDESIAFSFPPLTEEDVVSCLLKIDSNKSTGVDGISSRMLGLSPPQL